MNKPSNWYSMDADERRTWEKQAREVEDLEYATQQERECREAAEEQAAQLRRQAKRQRSELDELAAELREINAEVGQERARNEALLQALENVLAVVQAALAQAKGGAA